MNIEEIWLKTYEIAYKLTESMFEAIKKVVYNIRIMRTKIMDGKKSVLIKILASVSFVVMVIINALANIVPFGGANTGEISGSYPNLFEPAPITFSLWIIIYILLGVFTLYQAGIIKNTEDKIKQKLIVKMSLIFMVTSIVNTGWILVWHYRLIGLSLILMTTLLTLLIVIMLELKHHTLTDREEVFVRIPFSIYFGWITVASIANVVTFFVSVNWDGYGLPDSFWAVVVLALGAIIGAIAIYSYSDFFYGIVLIWAYSGILLKHLSASGFSGEYTNVIITTCLGIVLFIIMDAILLVRESKSKLMDK